MRTDGNTHHFHAEDLQTSGDDIPHCTATRLGDTCVDNMLLEGRQYGMDHVLVDHLSPELCCKYRFIQLSGMYMRSYDCAALALRLRLLFAELWLKSWLETRARTYASTVRGIHGETVPKINA